MGILITNQGTITLPCALITLGIPMLAIGKHRCNRSIGGTFTISSNNSMHCPAVIFPFSTTSTSSADIGHNQNIPFQWMVGTILLYLAVICILIELGIFSNIFETMFNRNGNTNGSTAKADSDVETELLAAYYDPQEILQLIQENNMFVSQQRYRKMSHSEDDGSSIEMDGNDRSSVEGESKHEHSKVNPSSSKVANELQETKPAEEFQSKAITYLNALALKVQKSESRKPPSKEDTHASSTTEKDSTNRTDKSDKSPELHLLCQQAAYQTISIFQNQTTNQKEIDQTLSAAISLLALIAKHPSVRKQHLYSADLYGLDVPIKAMRTSLKRAKDVLKPEEGDEIIAAELQRKACLMLGALADGDASNDGHGKDLTTKIVEEDGLEAILEALDWYRYHAEVVNWGLWALFMLCFDHVGNKGKFVRIGGIDLVCRVMKTILEDYTHELEKLEELEQKNEESQEDEVDHGDWDWNRKRVQSAEQSANEVARHGIAILFDVLRYDDTNPGVDFAHIRRVSLNAGMHEVVKTAMLIFDDNTEIMMMGQQMLIATGFTGDMPKFAGPLVPAGK